MLPRTPIHSLTGLTHFGNELKIGDVVVITGSRFPYRAVESNRRPANAIYVYHIQVKFDTVLTMRTLDISEAKLGIFQIIKNFQIESLTSKKAKLLSDE